MIPNPETRYYAQPYVGTSPVIRSVADAIIYLRWGGTSLHQARFKCHDLIKDLLLAIPGNDLEHAAIAVAEACDRIPD